MSNPVKFSALLSMFFLLSCVTKANEKTISFEGFIEVPVVVENDKQWVTRDSYFMNNKDPLIGFDIMDEDDVQFIGSEKSAYDFLKAVFSIPSEEIEKTFLSTFSSYSFEERNYGEIQVFVLSEGDEIKAFILSKSIPFVLNLSIIGEDSEIYLEKILNKMKLTKKEN